MACAVNAIYQGKQKAGKDVVTDCKTIVESRSAQDSLDWSNRNDQRELRILIVEIVDL